MLTARLSGRPPARIAGSNAALRSVPGNAPGNLRKFCPAGFSARLSWLARAWADEPMPERMHSVGGVYFGAPDRESCPDPARLGARLSTAGELVGGSMLGSPRVLPAFERYIEHGETETDSDGCYRRPLAAALAKMARGDVRTNRPARELGAKTIWAVLRSRGDWHAVALEGKWPEEMFRDYLSGSIAELYELYAIGRGADRV